MNSHRQIIVTGVPTAGKTTFCHELVKKFSLQNIQTDSVITAFQNTFPELGITHKTPHSQNLAEHLAIGEKFKPFLFAWIDALKDQDFVIEGFRFPVEDIIERYGPTHQIFIFGYPNATPEERVARCRKFDLSNWTNRVSDEDLKVEFAYLIQESKRLEEICKKNNVPFFDMEKDYIGEMHKAIDMVK